MAAAYQQPDDEEVLEGFSVRQKDILENSPENQQKVNSNAVNIYGMRPQDAQALQR